MDALGGAVRDELRGGVVGVQLDLVDLLGLEGEGGGREGGRTAGTVVVEGSRRRMSRLWMPKLEMPMLRALDFGSFCISRQVSRKFQSEKTFVGAPEGLEAGSREAGQCMRYRST